MITAATVLSLSAGSVLAFALPIGLLLWWRRTRRARLTPFFVGAFCFAVFALGLEQLLHLVCLARDNPVSRAIHAAPWLYVLYGCLAAGVFEETARWFGFRVLLKKHPGRNTAVTCGIGHGGAECMVLLGVNYLVYALLAAFCLTANQSALLAIAGGNAAALAELTVMLARFTPGTVALALLERAAALALHISLSVLVFLAARDRRARRYFPLAILLHALADIPAALYQLGLLPMPLTELCCCTAALSVLYLARRLYLEHLDP